MNLCDMCERNLYHECDEVCKEKKYYEQGRADGYSQAETDYHKKTEEDRANTYECGYEEGKASALQEALMPYDVESIEELIKKVKDKTIEEISNLAYCRYNGDCMGSKETCKNCNDYVVNYEDIQQLNKQK